MLQLVNYRYIGKKSYLGVKPDIVINNYSIYEDDNDNEANSEGPLPLPINDKQILHTSSKHDTPFHANTSCIVSEKRKHVSISNGNDDTVSPFHLSFPSFLESAYSQKYRIS